MARAKEQSGSALRALDSQGMTLLDNLNDAIFLHHRSGRLLAVNTKACDLLGYSREQLLQRGLADILPPEAFDEAVRHVEEIFTKGELVFQTICVTRRGRQIPIEVSSCVIEHEGCPAVLSVGRDITERKRMEQALRQSEKRYRDLYEGSRDGYARVTMDGKIVESNSTFRQILGYTPDELLSLTYEDITAAKWHETERRIVREQVLRRGYSDVFEKEYIRKDGSVTPIEIRICLLREDGGEPTGMWAFVREIGERKQAAEALREEHQFRTAIIEHAAEGLCVCHAIPAEPYVRFTVWNDRMTAITGYTMDQINRLGWYQTMYPDPEVRQKVIDRMARMREGDDLHGEEWEIARADGQRRTVLISSSVLQPAGGDAHVLALMHDVTQRKAAEQSLRMTQFAVDRAAGAVYWMTPDAKFFYVNDAACRSLGYTRDELLELTVHDVDPGFPREAWPAHWRELQEEKVLQFESHHRTKDGRVFPVEITANYLEFDGREFNFAFARDITARKQAEQEARLLTAFPAENPDPVMRVTTDGTLIYANRASRPLLDAWACRIGQRLPPALAEKAGEVFDAAADADVEVQYDGRTVVLRFSPTPDAGYVNLYGRDVTQRRQLEEQFRQAQKMEAVGRLAGGIAHDFNNQLTVIKGYTDILLTGMAEDAPLHEDLQEIAQACRRAQRLTGQLLAFSRKQVLRPEVTNLNDILMELQNPLSRMIGEDVRLSVIADPILGSVTVDRSQVQQAVMNLAVNARDAMPDGGRLTIETANVRLDEEYVRNHRDAQPGLHVMLAVTDTGKGMDDQTVQRIFEPFFTTKAPGKGTGLGLSMVYGFVKQSGGSIYVYSEPGRGTAFKVYLPRVAGEAAELEAADAEAGPPAGTETILVVEDDSSVRQLVVRSLEACGYSVLAAEEPLGALRISEGTEERIHLLVTEVVMPAMDGRQLAERICQARPGIQVLYLSGYTENAIVDHGVLMQGVNLLAKPFSPQALAHSVRRLLDEASDAASEG